MTNQAKSTPSKPPRVAVNDATLCGFLGYHLKRASNVVQADLAKTLKPFELRMLTFTALVLITDNPGLSQSQLADAMDVERPNLVVVVDELEQRELIVRERVPTDRRTYALKTTLKGRRLYDDAVKADLEREQNLLQGLNAETLSKVVEVMSLIRTRGAKG